MKGAAGVGLEENWRVGNTPQILKGLEAASRRAQIKKVVIAGCRAERRLNAIDAQVSDRYIGGDKVRTGPAIRICGSKIDPAGLNRLTRP